MIEIPWNFVLILRDLFVAAIAVFMIWICSLALRPGGEINDNTESTVIVFISFFVLMFLSFHWGVLVFK